MEIAVVTQGCTFVEVVANLHETVSLHLEGEDLSQFGLAPDAKIVIIQ